MQYLIYVLKDPRRPDAVRYVGITRQSLTQRLRQHIGTARNTAHRFPACCWVRTLLSAGVDPIIELIEATPDRSRETFWISHHLTRGDRLLNCHDRCGEEIIRSEETRRKLSERQRGCTPSPETRARISAALRGKKKSPEHVAKVAAKRRGCKHTDQTKARISALMRGRTAPPRSPRRACHRGHLLTGDNLYVDPQGHQICRACNRIKSRAFRALDSCPKGHPYSGDNLAYTCSGKRRCLICAQLKHETAKARREAARGKPKLRKPAPRGAGTPTGARHGGAKLTWPIVREMRRLVAVGTTQRQVAQRFDIGEPQTSMIIQGKAWIEPS